MGTCWKLELCLTFFLLSVTLKGVLINGQPTHTTDANRRFSEINVQQPSYLPSGQSWSPSTQSPPERSSNFQSQRGHNSGSQSQPRPVVNSHLEGSNNAQHWPQQLAGSSRSAAQNTVKIAVLGRSGSGVTSTIRELIGPNSECDKPEEEEPLKGIMEYTVDVPLSNNAAIGKVKILDIPGFIDGRTLEQEAQILATLKSYIQTEGPPDFYLALSRFDDNRIDGNHSLFVQSLKRIELFNDIFLNNTAITGIDNNIVFLLTRLMSETKVNQRKPDRKMGEFRRIIQEFTNFPSPISIVVGDNSAVSEYGVKEEDGYYKLPNKQLYPKNIWETLINSSSKDATSNLLTAIMNSREVALTCETKLFSAEWDNYDDDADTFSYLLTLTNKTVEDTEINREIENTFVRENSEEQKVQGIVQKIALQLRLQEANVTSKDHLPKNLAERAAFFQKNKQFSATIPAHLLNVAFRLRMPEYTKGLTVGYGYVVMEDEMSPLTPFRTTISEPSSVGYQIPNFMKCRKLIQPEIQYFKSYSVNMTEYFQERLKYLQFKGKKNVSESSLNFKVKEGFNMQPEEGENIATLTAVEERRIMTCKLIMDPNQWLLNAEFIEEVDSLMEFDRHDRDSVSTWQNWFSKWGSHIVVNSFGGGRLHGSVVGRNVKNVLESRATIDETLNSIIRYIPFPVNNLEAPAYRLYGGESDAQSENLYTLEENERKRLIERWEDSLNSDFIMLTNEFRLLPISKIVREKISKRKGQIVLDAIELLLHGELKYERRRKPAKEGGSKSQGNRNSVDNSNRGQIGNSEGTNHRLTSPPQHNIPNTPTPQSHFSETPRSHSVLQASSPTDHNSDVAQTVLQSQIDNNNMMIKSLEQRIADKRNRDEQQYQKDLADLERLKAERKRYAEERAAQMEESYRQSMQNKQSYYQSHIDTLKQQTKQEEDSIRRQIEDIQTENDAAERRHQLMLQEIKRQQEEEAERERKRCEGFLKTVFKTSCW